MNSRTGRKSIVSEEFFVNSSEQRDYILGLLCTDGYIGKDDYTIQISLSEDDRELLEKISNITNVPLAERKLRKGRTKKLISYRFRNKQIHTYLSSVGITNKKTHSLKLHIPLNNHILRGIFDGDGSVFLNNYNNKIVNIVSASKGFIDQIHDFLEDNKIEISSVKFHNNVFHLNIYRKSEVEKFRKLVYNNATLYMERKYIKFNAV